MSKIVKVNVICACCGNNINIDRILSFSYDKIGLSGNKHTSMQYKVEECPECHYTSFDIGDSSVRVSRGMLNSFRMKPGTERITDPVFISLLKAADVYQKNKDYHHHEHALRLASFFAEEQHEIGLSRELLRQANEALQLYFECRDELSLPDIMLAINLIDGNRRLGMTATAKSMCGEILELLEDVDGSEISELCRLIEFERTLLNNRDIAEHFISEVF